MLKLIDYMKEYREFPFLGILVSQLPETDALHSGKFQTEMRFTSKVKLSPGGNMPKKNAILLSSQKKNPGSRMREAALMFVPIEDSVCDSLCSVSPHTPLKKKKEDEISVQFEKKPCMSRRNQLKKLQV